SWSISSKGSKKIGRRGAPFPTNGLYKLTRLKVVTDTNRVGGTITRCIGRCNIIAFVICQCTVGVIHVYVLIAAEKARTLAQIMDRTYREAVNLPSLCVINATGRSGGHTALGHQGCIAPLVLTTCVPDVAITTSIHGGITLSCAARTVKRICRQGSGSSTGCGTDSVVDVFILTMKFEVFECPGSTNSPHLFGFKTDALLELIGIVPGVATEYIHSHAHEIGMVFGSGLAVEIAIPATGIALTAQATREKAL